MNKKTSAHMQACKGEIAEIHNNREKELDYIRPDLSHLNKTKQWISVAAQLSKIKDEYRKATGQKMQPTAKPIQEIVIVTDKNTTPEQIEYFCELIKGLGMTPLSYAIHNDEGHIDANTNEWKPNHHAHILVDTTCWQHIPVSRTKKKNGKTVFQQDTGLPVKISVDGYAKTIKFSREDMQKLQDFAAQATGLVRGIPSDKRHINALEFKVRELTSTINELSNQLTESEYQIHKQKQTIANNRDVIHSAVLQLKELAPDIVASFDTTWKLISKSFSHELSPALKQYRNTVTKAITADYSSLSLDDAAEVLPSLSRAITSLAVATTKASGIISSVISENTERKQKILNELNNKLKTMTLWNTAKGSALALLGFPANKQIEELKQSISFEQGKKKEALLKNEEQQATIEALTEQNEKHERKIKEAQKIFDSLTSEGRDKDATIQKLNEEIIALKSNLTSSKQKINSWLDDFKNIALDLVNHSDNYQIRQFESRNLHKIIGENIWSEAIRLKQGTNIQQDYPQKGMHL